MNENCQHFEETCSGYVEHELPQGEKDHFVKHLNACPACQKKVAHLKMIRSSLRHLARIQPSRDFETVLRAQIQMSKNIGRPAWASTFERFKFPAYTVSMAAVVATIFFLHLNSPANNQAIPLHSTDIEHAFVSDDDIQDGDVVYSVDVLTQPQTSMSIKVPEKRKSVVMRSMILAPGAAQMDSLESSPNRGSAAIRDHYSVSF